MINIDAKGWVHDASVKLEPRSAIDKGPIGKINAIVLHRTASRNASSVLAAWKSKPEGAHFLISETGAIYQCVSLKSQCWHVGKLYAKCRTTSSCSKEDETQINELLERKKTSWGTKFRLITKHELDKNYPDRFPHNHDSIGIEVVGMISSQSEMYEIPNSVQLESVFWLLDKLIASYQLKISDVYAHGQIAHKDPKKSEGAATLKAFQVAR